MDVGSGARPHTPGLGAPRSPLKGIGSYPEGIRSRSLKRGDGDRWGRKGGISFLLPWPTTLGAWRASHQPLACLYKGGEAQGAATLPPLAAPLSHILLLFRVAAWRSPAGVPLPPPPPRRRAGSDPIYLSTLPCWIKKAETSPSRTCANLGGAARAVLGSDWIATRVRLRQPRSLDR